MYCPFLGREYSQEEIKLAIDQYQGIAAKYTEQFSAEAARLIADGFIVGWFQERSETGPRALGHRSILADPRRADMKDLINQKVKFRENFRPFAPSVLWEYQEEYFDLDIPSPYMLIVADIYPEKQKVIPAVTHVDGTGRLQTVVKEIDPVYHQLISDFYKLTGVPVVLNTSFNVKGEPIIETPQDALNCFLHTNIDYLVMGNYVVSKIK